MVSQRLDILKLEQTNVKCTHTARLMPRVMQYECSQTSTLLFEKESYNYHINPTHVYIYMYSRSRTCTKSYTASMPAWFPMPPLGCVGGGKDLTHWSRHKQNGWSLLATPLLLRSFTCIIHTYFYYVYTCTLYLAIIIVGEWSVFL